MSTIELMYEAYQKTYAKTYSALNAAQKQAVDTIDGPVMVVAGPGTGKTQLLSTRVANILLQSDALPSNILCLTFTESAATAMRQRLFGLMGQEAYKVAIHTFHSFGTEVINHNPAYFYKGANFRPADELSSYEILDAIFTNLPHSNPLASTMNGQFTALRDAQFAIGNLKKAGLTPDELLAILDHNDTFMDKAEPHLANAFDVPRLNKKDIPELTAALDEINKITVGPSPIGLIKPLADVCRTELAAAIAEATEQGSTKALTAWRNRWLERNHARQFVFKERSRSKKLRALAKIYHKYLLAMQERELFDFDDMILRVVHALEHFAELRYNLQEQYQYILVDEFQDTNGAQLRLLQNLTNNEANAGRPNIMVVGDDDQAIYAFQGAEIGNILQFTELFKQPTVITLTDNYRSTDTILRHARQVIVQGQYRLETQLAHIDKTLTAHQTATDTQSELHSFATPAHQYSWIIQQIQQQLASGTPASDIAILARNHRQLLEILPFLRQAGLQVHYERRNNVLETEHIAALVLLARAVAAVADQQFEEVDALLPQLLSYDFWGLPTSAVWQVSLQAYRERKMWLEIMLERTDKLRAIAEFLIVAGHESLHEPLESMLDLLMGSAEVQADDTDQSEPFDETNNQQMHEGFTSPFRDYYFNEQRLQQNPASYLTMLSNLVVIRQHLREYRPDRPLSLRDFVDFVQLHEKTGLQIVDTAQHQDNAEAITLMTAHKSKGLEFDTVFVISCQESIWGTSARNRSSSLSFPHNLPIEPAGQSSDDCLRLFFVAMTRARTRLFLTTYRTDESGKESLPLGFLRTDTFAPITHDNADELISAETLEPNWTHRHLHRSPAEREALLAPRLQTYRLSATHLNNFIDVTNGGPQAFLLQNMLRFPQAMGLGAVFGSAIHATLQHAHLHVANTGEPRPIEDILHDFDLQLQRARLSERDYEFLQQKGSDTLQAYLGERQGHFKPHQRVEYSFANQSVTIDEVRLTGAIDLMEIDEQNRAIHVLDYKTGKPASSWQGKTDFEKIKLHKYRQQLMLYKLLVEHSRDFGHGYQVRTAVLEFVEPDAYGQLKRLEMAFDADELARFKLLLRAVWQRIMNLDLPDISKYPQNYKGILQFEQDLLDHRSM